MALGWSNCIFLENSRTNVGRTFVAATAAAESFEIDNSSGRSIEAAAATATTPPTTITSNQIN